MHKLKILLLCLFCFGSFSAFSQKSLHLKPFIGLQNPYCHYDREVGKADAFKVNYFMKTDNFGLLLELPLNEDWVVSTGLSKGNIGWGFGIIMPDEITNNPSGIGPQRYGARANYIYRFPLLIKRNLKQVTFLELDPARNLYLLNFKLYTQAGLSFDVLDPLARFDGGRTLSGNNHGDFIQTIEEVTILNNKNMSAWIGLGTQFYQKDKPRFDLTLFYSQGFKNMLAIDVNYMMNNVQSQTRLLTRGAVLGLTLGYPIRLKTFKAKTEA